VLSTIGEARQAVLRLTRANRFSSAPDSPSFLTTGGRHSRDSRGPDKSDRRSWGFERNDPGCIRALRAGRNSVVR
jgi:hypothetical protein